MSTKVLVHPPIAVEHGQEGTNSREYTFVRSVVAAGEYRTSTRGRDVFVTYNVTSGVAISLYDPVTGIGGLLHASFPSAQADPMRARVNPALFVDTGLECLIRDLVAAGARKERLIAKIAGGANHSKEDQKLFRGEQNFTMVRATLMGQSIPIEGHQTGSTKPLTMVFYLSTGRTCLRGNRKEEEI